MRLLLTDGIAVTVVYFKIATNRFCVRSKIRLEGYRIAGLPAPENYFNPASFFPFTNTLIAYLTGLLEQSIDNDLAGRINP
jgi:hypothetical protein